MSMAEHGALAVFLEPGQPPRLASPIPDLSLVALDALLSARLREWMQVDGDLVRLAGHRFTVVGWSQQCLVLRHDCCA